MTYYADQKNLTSPKGDLLLVDDTIISDEDIPGVKYAFKVVTPFETIILSADSKEEQNSWKLALMKSLDLIQNSFRGYMIKKGTSAIEPNARKFFVFHDNILYYHKDHEHTTSCQGYIRITPTTKFLYEEKLRQLTVFDDQTSITMIFEERNLHEMAIWSDAIGSKISKASSDKKKLEVKANIEKSTLKGILGVRPPNGGDSWKSMFVSLVKNEIVMMTIDSTGSPQSIADVFVVTVKSACNETTLRSNSFEIVSPDRILHLCTKTRETRDEWIKNIKALLPVAPVLKQRATGEIVQEIVQDDGTVIEVPAENSSDSVVTGLLRGGLFTSARMGLSNDVIHLDALLLIPKDRFYEVKFKENKAIGIVLERAAEWAIAKIADTKETGVLPGSALTAVNAETVIFDQYQQTIGRFKNWQPPLTLLFRAAPSKFGYLKVKNKSGGKWKKYYYSLNQGKLGYKNTDDPAEKNIAEISLVGAIVSFVPKEDCGKKYCFKFLSGAQCLILHAHTTADMRAWAAILYHAIAIANGGRHIIDYERKRLQEQEARNTALQAQQVQSENKYIVELIQTAIADESKEKLAEALSIADQAGLCGEFIDYSRDYMIKLSDEESMRASVCEPLTLDDVANAGSVSEMTTIVEGNEEDGDENDGTVKVSSNVVEEEDDEEAGGAEGEVDEQAEYEDIIEVPAEVSQLFSKSFNRLTQFCVFRKRVRNGDLQPLQKIYIIFSESMPKKELKCYISM